MLLRDTVYKIIRSAILNCEFAPEQELREQILAEKYRVSRSPVRDALLRLEQENLVTVLPRQGYLVNAITLGDVQDFFALRLLIEPACAAGAARQDDDALRALDRFRTFAADDPLLPKFVSMNNDFHFAVADLCGNRRMAVVASDLIEQSGRILLCKNPNFDNASAQRLMVEHRAIIDAIQAHDPEKASRLAYVHAAGKQSDTLATFGPVSGGVGASP